MRKRPVPGWQTYLRVMGNEWQTEEEIKSAVIAMMGKECDFKNLPDFFVRCSRSLMIESRPRPLDPNDPNSKEITEYRHAERLRTAIAECGGMPRLAQRVVQSFRNVRPRRWWDRLI